MPSFISKLFGTSTTSLDEEESDVSVQSDEVAVQSENSTPASEALTKSGLKSLWNIIKTYISDNSMSTEDIGTDGTIEGSVPVFGDSVTTASPENNTPIGEGNPSNLE